MSALGAIFLKIQPVSRNYRILQGDCLERMQELPDQSIDMVLCDPPYAMTHQKWDSIIPLEPMWDQLKRIVKPKGAILLFGAQPFTAMLICSNLKMFRYMWVWDKMKSSGHLNCNRAPLRYHEEISVFYAKAGSYKPQMTKGKMMLKGGSKGGDLYLSANNPVRYQSDTYYPKSIISIKGLMGHEKIHPTEKPVPLLEYMIKTYTEEGETVLDFCAGSGSTAEAAIRTGRKFIGIELDPKWHETSKHRAAITWQRLNRKS